MYRQIESYIVDNFGEKGNSRFVIAPDDTPYACTCATCTALGNTEKNATPAVTELIIRLSQRFPKHFFFTTSYLTTQQVTDKQLPSNAGVIVSAIDYPLRRTDGKNEQDKKFADQLDNWKKVTNNIYIWDYINNFDDLKKQGYQEDLTVDDFLKFSDGHWTNAEIIINNYSPLMKEKYKSEIEQNKPPLIPIGTWYAIPNKQITTELQEILASDLFMRQYSSFSAFWSDKQADWSIKLRHFEFSPL